MLRGLQEGWQGKIDGSLRYIIDLNQLMSAMVWLAVKTSAFQV